MARGLGNQNMKKYHMWNLSHQDISNKVSTLAPPCALACCSTVGSSLPSVGCFCQSRLQAESVILETE